MLVDDVDLRDAFLGAQDLGVDAVERTHHLARLVGDRGQGIDNVGLAPTVRLDPAAPDLVEQVRAWYRGRK